MVTRNRFIIWYGLRSASFGGAGGRGDVGVVGRLPGSMGGGGTSAVAGVVTVDVGGPYVKVRSV